MDEQEHLAIARRLEELADRLYQGGDDVLAAEALWGAVNRIINAIAIQQGLAGSERLPRRGVVLHHLTTLDIADQQTNRVIRIGMDVAGELHGHFYNSHLSPDEVAEQVADAWVFIAYLTGLYHRGGSQ